MAVHHNEGPGATNLLDCVTDYHGKLFDISMETKKVVARRLTKSKKENKVRSLIIAQMLHSFLQPVGLPSSSASAKKPCDDRQVRQTFKQVVSVRVSRPLTYNEHFNTDTRPGSSATFVRKPCVPSPCNLTAASSSSPRRRARSFEPRAHTTTLFDKTINPFQKLRVILKRNE